MHPFTPNLNEMSESDLQKNHSELMKKVNMAYRMGNASLIAQLQMMLDDYNSEVSRRQQKQLDEILSKNNKFSNIIDIK